MPAVEFRNTIRRFLARGRHLQAADIPWTGSFVLQLYLDWYRTTRVRGATPRKGGDMLLLQWGATNRIVGSEVPTDLRRLDDSEMRYEKRERNWLDFSRQVCPDKDLENFDDVAVHLSIGLFYGFGTRPGSDGHVIITSPDDIHEQVAEFQKDGFVNSLLAIPTKRVSIVVNGAG